LLGSQSNGITSTAASFGWNFFNTHLQLLVIYLDTIVQTHIQNPIYATAHSRTPVLQRR
jgi:hypothetical protein